MAYGLLDAECALLGGEGSNQARWAAFAVAVADGFLHRFWAAGHAEDGFEVPAREDLADGDDAHLGFRLGFLLSFEVGLMNVDWGSVKLLVTMWRELGYGCGSRVRERVRVRCIYCFRILGSGQRGTQSQCLGILSLLSRDATKESSFLICESL